jgi:hypothetical protein
MQILNRFFNQPFWDVLGPDTSNSGVHFECQFPQ